ncbi:MAG: M48 family peptidase, partial [Betaproteobacteria bacterium]|nr:M48 family peptidase [Betaproteobacteria bacterium]
MSFDVQAATDNYINALGPEALARAAAYTSGSHWTLLWGFLISTAVAWLVIKLQVLDKLEDKLKHKSLWLRSFAISGAYLFLSSLLTLPWTLYADWWREMSYGKTSQPLSDFLSQGSVSLLISTLLGGLFLSGVYFFIRRLGRYWWAWSGGLTAVTVSTLMMIGPLWIEPLFNKYTPLPPGEVREALEELAKQAKIQPDRIFVYNGS